MKRLALIFFSVLILSGTSSCHRDKISCPTYAYSFPFPDKTPKKKRKLAALSPNKTKGSKTVSGVMPRNSK